MPNVYTDINDFMPYARSMAKRIIREGKHDGVQQFTNDLVTLSNDIYKLAQEMPDAWEQYRKITSERERQSREIAERQRYIEELNQHLAEQFGMPDVGSGDNDTDILSMLSDDDAFDFGDDDGAMDSRHDGTGDAMPTAQPNGQTSTAAYAQDAGTDDTQDDDDGLFAVFGGDYGNDGNGRDAAESDSWGNADERANLVGDDGSSFADAYADAGDGDAPKRNDDDSEQPDIDWSAAGNDGGPQEQPVEQSSLPPQQQQTAQAQPPQQKGGTSGDPFDDDDIDVLLDDDALLNL